LRQYFQYKSLPPYSTFGASGVRATCHSVPFHDMTVDLGRERAVGVVPVRAQYITLHYTTLPWRAGRCSRTGPRSGSRRAWSPCTRCRRCASAAPRTDAVTIDEATVWWPSRWGGAASYIGAAHNGDGAIHGGAERARRSAPCRGRSNPEINSSQYVASLLARTEAGPVSGRPDDDGSCYRDIIGCVTQRKNPRPTWRSVPSV
jgi:hypothetical protein